MTSEIDKLKHFHIEDYSGTNFTDDLNDGEKFLYTTNGGFVGSLGLSKKLWKKYIEASYKYRTNTDKMTASDYTHLFGYLNPYYRSAYNVSKRRK